MSSDRSWLSVIEQASMQAVSVSRPYSQLIDQQVRSVALEQAMVTMSNQLADANRSLEGWAKHSADQERAIASLHEALDLQRATIHHLRQVMLAHGVQMSDPPQADAPEASPNRSVVDQTIDALDKRLVGRTDRVRLRGALDKADAPLTGKDAANEAIGRIARLVRS